MGSYLRDAILDVLRVFVPANWVFENVLSDLTVFFAGPNDALVIVPLPDGMSRVAERAVYRYGGERLEGAHDLAERRICDGRCFGRRGAACCAPCDCADRLGESEDCVDMVGHHDEFTQFGRRKSSRQAEPCCPDCVTSRVQNHLSAGYRTEDVFSAVGADGDEIVLGLGIIEPPQPKGAAALFDRVVHIERRLIRGRSKQRPYKTLRYANH